MECKHALILIWLSITTQTLSFSPKQLTVSQIIYQKGWFHSNTSIHVTQSIITMNEPNCTSMTLLIHWSCWYKFEFVVYDGAIFKWIKWFSAAKFSILLNNLYLLAKNSNICNHVALCKFLFKPVFGLVSFLHPIKNISIFTCVCATSYAVLLAIHTAAVLIDKRMSKFLLS